MKDIKQFISESMICELSSELLKRAADKAEKKAKDAEKYGMYREKKRRLKQAEKFKNGHIERKKQEEKEELEKWKASDNGKWDDALSDSVYSWCEECARIGCDLSLKWSNEDNENGVFGAYMDYLSDEEETPYLALFAGGGEDLDIEDTSTDNAYPIIVISSKEIIFIRRETNKDLIKEVMSIINVPGNKLHVTEKDFANGSRDYLSLDEIIDE